MASSPLSNGGQRSHDAGWARLIPGQAAVLQQSARKPVQSIRPPSAADVTEMATPTVADSPGHVLASLIPRPLQGRTAHKWLRSTAADFALVGVNWLLIGALLVPLRQAFPQIRTFHFASGSPFSLLGIALLHAALITLLGYSENLYTGRIVPRERLIILGKSVFGATAILGLAYGLQTPWTISGLIAMAGLLHFGALYTWRRQIARQERLSENRGDVRNVLIIGAGAVGQRLSTYLDSHPEDGRCACGFLDDDQPLGDQIIGRTGDLARLARSGFIDEVILAAPRDRQLALKLLSEARRLRLDVDMVPELFECRPAATDVERLGDLPVICLHEERLPVAALVLKRVIDVVGAALAFLALAPLMAAIALLVKIDSSGPVFYTAQRAGRKGRLFFCCKFRTMISNADTLKNALRQDNQRSGPFFKIADDPRITRIGRLLRRYSLDELPQLWNVLWGDMSLVGPRPHPLDDVASYELVHLARLDVTPGITGLWQVKARRDPSFERGMELDREYIRTWCLRLDLQILAKTILAVVRGSGE